MLDPRYMQQLDLLVGGRATFARNQAGFTVKAAAEAIGCTVDELARYEAGQKRITPRHLEAMMQVYDVEACFFFEGEAFDDTLDEWIAEYKYRVFN